MANVNKDLKIRFIYPSPSDNNPQDEIKDFQQDEREIYSLLGANIDEREFYARWASLGITHSPTELVGLDNEDIQKKEISRKRQKEIKEKIGSVCFRIRFVEALQYENRFTEKSENLQSDALQIYLLCTCLDTLAGQSSHKRFDDWLSEKDEMDLFKDMPKNEENQELAKWYKQVTKNLFEKYLEEYGVSRNFKKLFSDLPNVLKNEIADSFIVIKENESKESWIALHLDNKLQRIVDYLFARRNKFTHNSDVIPTLGSKQEFHTLEFNNKKYKVFIAKSDAVRSETSVLRLVLVGILKNMLGYQLDEQFLKLYWFIEKNKKQFRDILNELRRNYSLQSWYLRNQFVDNLETISSDRLKYFRTEAFEALLANNETDLDWFFGIPNVSINKEIRKDLMEYIKQILYHLNKTGKTKRSKSLLIFFTSC